MARIPYFDMLQAPSSYTDLLGARKPLNFYRMLPHGGKAAEGFLKLGGALLRDNELDSQLREVAILRVGMLERGYPKGKIYQTHGAATMDLIRVGGADVEGSFVSSGPAVVAEKLPDSNASKALGMQFKNQFEAANDKGSANQFAAHAFDVVIVLQEAVPRAEEEQARHARVRRRAERCVRDHRPHTRPRS